MFLTLRFIARFANLRKKILLGKIRQNFYYVKRLLQNCEGTLDLELQKRMGERIRIARERLGLRQEDLAQKLRTTRVTITHWEGGINSPHVTDLPLLAKILGVSILYFFEDEEGEKGDEEP